MPYLVMLETAGNQQYIFATRRQREQVGASELIARSTTDWVREALPPQGARVVSAASGKSLLVADSAEVARAIVAAVTARALKEAPGLTLRGVTVPYGDDVGDEALASRLPDAVAIAHASTGEARAALPTAAARFPRDPLTAVCADSGLPATRYARAHLSADPSPRSAASAAKRAAADDGYERLEHDLKRAVEAGAIRIPRQQDERDAIRRPAVAHIDGNGIGGLFGLLATVADAVAGDDGDDVDERYAELAGSLSAGLDEVTKEALADALIEAHRDNPDDHADRGDDGDAGRDDDADRGDEPGVAMLPLILGGDDVTGIIDGPRALQVATSFLRAFERRTADVDGPLGAVLSRLQPDERSQPADVREAAQRYARGLSASAGFAVVPRAYPFHTAYELAESASKSAKRAKRLAPRPDGRMASAIDFHVHYDRSGGDLREIRLRRAGGEGADRIELAAGPYVLVDDDWLKPLAADPEPADGDAWGVDELRYRDVRQFEAWLAALRGPTAGDEAAEPALSRTSVHRLRAAVTAGHAAWEAERAFLRWEQEEWLAERERTLVPLVAEVGGSRRSILLDVLDLAHAEVVGGE